MTNDESNSNDRMNETGRAGCFDHSTIRAFIRISSFVFDPEVAFGSEAQARREPQAQTRREFRFLLCLFVLTCSLVCVESAHAQMRQKTTAHYIVHTDVDPDLAQDLCHRMDSMYEEYARRLVEFSPPTGGAKF